MNYPYVCTKVRARKSLLFGKEEYLNLSRMTNLGELFEALANTHYGPFIEQFGNSFEGLELLHHITQFALGREYSKVYKMLDWDLQKAMMPFFLKLDMFNLLSIIRATEGVISPEELRLFIIPSPFRDYINLISTFKEDFSGILSVLSSHPLMHDVLGRDAVDMEKKVQLNWLSLIKKMKIPVVKKYIRHFLEIQNRLAILKKKAASGDPVSIQVENEFEETLLKEGARLMRLNPLSVAPIVSYLSSKEIEVRNIRIIGYEINMGFGSEKIMGEIIVENRSAR